MSRHRSRIRAGILCACLVFAQAASAQAASAQAPASQTKSPTQSAEALVATGQLDAAEAAFKEALQKPPALRAHVLYARLLIERGRREEAQPHLELLITAYNDDQLGATDRERAATLCYVAMAARMLGSAHDANDTFREAALADRSRVETQLEWAELFLEKHDVKHARESALEALGHKPKSARALVLMARLVLAQSFDFEKAEGYLAAALASTNPGQVGAHVGAHVTRASMALREMDIERADRHLDAALAINPNHLEALSMRAAVRFLADDASGFASAEKAVLQRNPRFSRMYSIIAEHAEWEHRYTELVGLAKKALLIDPQDASAHATLAMNLLRLGNEKEGRPALDEAWKRDHFNAHVLNMLNLYENVIEREYVDFEAAPFVLRMHKQERAVLEPYVPRMLRDAYAVMQKHYGFTPEGPLRIEMYSDTEHFSVRTTGMPNVGVQGVCFGKVITAVSPAAGPYNWGQITWHELAHVFHLQLSKNHVPRWFTEGLAEHETVVARTEWRREEDSSLWTAFAQDRVPKLGDLNRTFTQAKSPQALMTAYYLASQAVGYIVDRFGWDKMRPMLLAWGQGKRTPEVFQEVLGVSLEDVDRDLRAHLRKRLQRFERDFHIDFSKYNDIEALQKSAQQSPTDANAHAALALGLVGERRLEEGERAAKRALELNPKHTGALFALTRVELQNEDLAEVDRLLRAILATGQDGYVIRILLARAALASKRPDVAMKEAEAAIAVDPDQLEAHRVLLEVAAMKANTGAPDRALAMRSLQALAQLDQHDPALQLAWITALREAKDYKGLKVAAERALFLMPAQPDVHLALGEGLLAAGEPAAALVEIDRATSLGHRRPEEVSRVRAQAVQAMPSGGSKRGKAAKPARENGGPNGRANSGQ